MPTSADRAISLSFSQAVMVLMEACEVPPAGRQAFEARIRQLQRLGAPPRERDQGGRIAYGIAELAMLATALKLMAAFMTPALAARYVVERWNVLAPFALAGAREALPPGYVERRTVSSNAVALFDGNALADIGARGRHGERYMGTLGAVTTTSAAADSSLPFGAGLFIDSGTYMATIVSRVIAVTLATDVELSMELDRLHFTDV